MTDSVKNQGWIALAPSSSHESVQGSGCGLGCYPDFQYCLPYSNDRPGKHKEPRFHPTNSSGVAYDSALGDRKLVVDHGGESR